MPKNESLHQAKRAKNDEFYTQYADIEREMNAYLEYNPDVFRNKTILLPCDDPEWSNFTKYFAQNFENFGLKKLISTSYAADSKPKEITYQPTLFELNDPKFDQSKTRSHGKIFVLEKDQNKDEKININDLEWNYLEGDGDFRSKEVCKLRDEADIIITNPPFSQFRDFLAWVIEVGKSFCIISNMNAITYKEVFPLIQHNKAWLGNGFNHGNAYFGIPQDAIAEYASGVYDSKTKLVKFRNCCWFTNLDHGRRHQPLSLMTMADNLKYSKHKEIRERGYPKYDNYDAIEVSYTDAIPSDYKSGMGVPISFLDKYCPEQFEIEKFRKGNDEKDLTYTIEVCENSLDETRRDETRRDETRRDETRRDETSEANNHAVLQNHHSEQDVMASWACQSPSSTSSAQNNSKSLATNIHLALKEDGATSTENVCIRESLLEQRSSWVMGVPISFLDKFCPEQFEIIGATESEGKGFSNGLWDKNSRTAQPLILGKRVYKRIFIKFKEK